jgi:hypothetical protein
MPAIRIIALSLLCAWSVETAAEAARGWRVLLRNQDVTRDADPSFAGGVLSVNAAALAGAMRLGMRIDSGQLHLTDAAGVDWVGIPGATVLSGAGRMLPLALPWRLEGSTVRLSLAALAEIAGLDLALDPKAGTARLTDPDQGTPAGELTGGWQGLTIAKPASAIAAEHMEDVTVHRAPPRSLPPASESLAFGLRTGCVLGLDCGAELHVAGSVDGLRTSFESRVSQGPAGSRLERARLQLDDPVVGWELQAGDIFSELAGSAHGARFSFDRGAWHLPSLAVYRIQEPDGQQRTFAALRESMEVTEHATVVAEAGSDRAWLLRGRWRDSRLEIASYMRRAVDSAEGGNAAGVSASLALPLNAGLQGSYGASGSGALRLGLWSVDLRVPVRSLFDLNLETSRSSSVANQGTLQALSTHSAFGPLQVYVRLQRLVTTTTVTGAVASLAPSDERELIGAVGYSARGFHLDVQLSRSLAADGAIGGQVVGGWNINSANSVEILAGVGAGTQRRLLRVRHDFSRQFGVTAEYGSVAPLQSSNGSFVVTPPKPQVLLSIRTAWSMSTPAGGERVQGAVRDPLGRPLPGLPVVLGKFRTYSDDAGRYSFDHVPPGSSGLALDRQNLPASYLASAPVRQLELAGRGTIAADLTAVPLGSVSGRVLLIEADGVSRPMAGVVVFLDDRATRSVADGAFAFANVRPGTHKLRMEPARLPAALRARAPWTMDLGLPPGKSLDGVKFQLEPRPIPLVLQEVR